MSNLRYYNMDAISIDTQLLERSLVFRSLKKEEAISVIIDHIATFFQDPFQGKK